MTCISFSWSVIIKVQNRFDISEKAGENVSVTIKDIARVCGVSYSTVSRVLNGKTVRQSDRNQHIIATARALGYKPHYIAKQLVEQRSDSIGLLIPDIANPHYPEITRNVQHFAEAAGYQVLIFNTDWDVTKECRLRDSLLEKRVAGMIVMPVCDESHLIFRGLEVPVAFLGTRTEEKDIDYVVMDNVRAAADATEHLIRSGVNSLAYIGRKIMNYTSFDRAQGFRFAAQKYGIPDERAVIAMANSFQEKGGYTAMRELLDAPFLPEGVLVFNDQLALGAMEAMEERGLTVGKDILLVSFDDLQFSSLSKISLTTITPSKEELGRLAVGCILRRIQNPDADRCARVLPSTMIHRKSG